MPIQYGLFRPTTPHPGGRQYVVRATRRAGGGDISVELQQRPCLRHSGCRKHTCDTINGKHIRRIVASRRVGVRRLLPAGRPHRLLRDYSPARLTRPRRPASRRRVRFLKWPNGKQTALARLPSPPPERHIKSTVPSRHRRRCLTAANHRRITDCTSNTKTPPAYARLPPGKHPLRPAR